MKNVRIRKSTMLCILLFIIAGTVAAQQPAMYFGDTTTLGRPYAKDPYVVYFGGRYLMYYSVPGAGMQQWSIGIAASKDLTHWEKVGNIKAVADYEKNGLCAPGALLKDGKVHLFYQTYGNGKLDAICHAVSDNGIDFIRNPTNPVFRPTGAWTCGRAIDAEIVAFKDRYLLFFATRDTAFKIQMQGVAATPLSSSFNRSEWKQLTDSSILKPQLPWEKNCIEAASCIQRGKYLYMFYAGGYNNEPQQIGVARSEDGVHWQRLSNDPILPNGAPGSWNASESGHPHIFRDKDGKTYLFFQGNNDKGRTWYLSRLPVNWKKDYPVVQH